jgi:predicted porin
MKKTIIAAAVAASFVAPVAMAEVSISGMVNPEFIDKDGATANDGWNASSINTDLVFKASDDLGNGMKATAKWHIFSDTTDQAFNQGSSVTETNQMADMSVTVSGDFGAVVVGRFEPASEGVMDAFVNVDASHDLDLENSLEGAIGRTNNGLAYSSPSMNGLSVGVGVFAGASSVVADDSFSGAQEVFVKYSNGPLTVMANQTTVDGTGTAAVTGVSDVEKTLSAVAASYKMGDLELRAMTRTYEAKGSTDKDSNFFGAKYTMGANTFAVGMLDNDTAATDANVYGVTHALSKNTSIALTVLDNDATNGDITGISVTQKF